MARDVNKEDRRLGLYCRVRVLVMVWVNLSFIQLLFIY